jgi:LmbE family N-acetylglucosaminyl deacetylase
MFNYNEKKILVLAPHTDDGEFGCGGTINKLISLGAEVHYVAFSACEQSVLPSLPKDILIFEVKEATKILGIREENLILFKYDVRTFNYHRQSILDDMIRLRKDLCPDIVFIPSLNDIHQDHFTIANEAMRAFKFDSLLCYELPWNNLNFTTSSFVHLDEEHVSKKVAALGRYKSQMHRNYANEEFVRSLARTRGVQVNTRYAEVFEVVRWIIK